MRTFLGTTACAMTVLLTTGCSAPLNRATETSLNQAVGIEAKPVADGVSVKLPEAALFDFKRVRFRATGTALHVPSPATAPQPARPPAPKHPAPVAGKARRTHTKAASRHSPNTNATHGRASPAPDGPARRPDAKARCRWSRQRRAQPYARRRRRSRLHRTRSGHARGSPAPSSPRHRHSGPA